VTGRILWQSPSFEPGEIVDAGEPLLRIDPTDYELALAEAKQALASAELSLADARALRQAARVDEAQATVAAAEAHRPRRARPRAIRKSAPPTRGDRRTARRGRTVHQPPAPASGASSARTARKCDCPSRRRISAFIDATARRRAPVRRVGSPERRWEGRLARIEARIDEQTRVFPWSSRSRTRWIAKRHGQPLPFGQFVRAEIAGGSRRRTRCVIPQAALHGDDDVFLLVDGQLRASQRDRGRISDGGALVTAD
jgi:multidrug efflux pump subunit AcrA (membrane-fusion protein)